MFAYYILICSSLYPFYCLCWEGNFSNLGPVVGDLQIDSGLIREKTEFMYAHVWEYSVMSYLLKTRNKRLPY